MNERFESRHKGTAHCPAITLTVQSTSLNACFKGAVQRQDRSPTAPTPVFGFSGSTQTIPNTKEYRNQQRGHGSSASIFCPKLDISRVACAVLRRCIQIMALITRGGQLLFAWTNLKLRSIDGQEMQNRTRSSHISACQMRTSMPLRLLFVVMRCLKARDYDSHHHTQSTMMMMRRHRRMFGCSHQLVLIISTQHTLSNASILQNSSYTILTRTSQSSSPTHTSSLSLHLHLPLIRSDSQHITVQSLRIVTQPCPYQLPLASPPLLLSHSRSRTILLRHLYYPPSQAPKYQA